MERTKLHALQAGRAPPERHKEDGAQHQKEQNAVDRLPCAAVFGMCANNAAKPWPEQAAADHCHHDDPQWAGIEIVVHGIKICVVKSDIIR